MDIDAIIAESTVPAPAQTETKADAITETTETEITEPQADDEVKADDPFPKKAVNALSRRDKQIGKLRAEKQHMQEELEVLRQKAAPKAVSNDSPKEGDFETYGDYLRAEARYAAKQEFNDSKVKDTEKQSATKHQEWEAERSDALDDNAEQAKTSFADFDKVVDAAMQSVNLSPHVKRAFLEVEDSAFALYALAKEGTLEDLNDMSPYKAAIAVDRMAKKGIELSKKKATNAPAPLSASRGAATGSKMLDDFSGDDIRKWLKS